MPLSTVDFNKGIDFTGLASAAAGDHNTLIDAATPFTDKGIIGETTDSALNIPVVPDATVTTKWKKYLWKRIPHSSASDQTPFVYVWNDAFSSIATYLKWRRITSDTTTELALITALTIRVTAVEITAATALTTSNAANANSSNAAADATDAVITATAASALATTAQATATAAQTTANEADTNADAAIAASGAASIVAGTANTTATAAAASVALVTAIQSADYGLTINSVIAIISHGFGSTAKSIRWVLYCAVDDPVTGHSVGHEVPLEHFTYNISGDERYNYVPFASRSSVSQIVLRLMNGIPQTMHVDGTTMWATITIANWRARCYYSKN